MGSPNDLDSFHDLFYKPNHVRASIEEHPLHSSSSGVLTGDIALRTRRTGSGLTSLARQLSEEFEQMERERERTDSQYSRSSGSVRLPLGLARRPTESSLQFVFEEGQRSASPLQEESAADLDTTEVFKPPFAVPEDVHSSNSSFVERTMEDEDDHSKSSLYHLPCASISKPLQFSPNACWRRGVCFHSTSRDSCPKEVLHGPAV